MERITLNCPAMEEEKASNVALFGKGRQAGLLELW